MKMLRDKPWYKSLTVAGVLTGAVGFLAHPAVTGVLPPKYSAAVGVFGAALATLGLRRAVADSSVMPSSGSSEQVGEWEHTFNAAGYNPYGETREDVERRRGIMDKTARDNRAFLQGPHYTPPAPGE
jgi:hypothetical protein